MKTVRMPPPGGKPPPDDEASPENPPAKPKPDPSSALPLRTVVMPGGVPRRPGSRPPMPSGGPPGERPSPGLPLEAAPLPLPRGAPLPPVRSGGSAPPLVGPAPQPPVPAGLPPLRGDAGLPPVAGRGSRAPAPAPSPASPPAPAAPLPVSKPAATLLPGARPMHSTRTAPRFTLRGVTRPGATVHPLAAPLYWASVDLLAVAAEIGLGATPPNAEDVRRSLGERFATMEERARAAGVTPEDIRDAQYPLMALFDELLVQLAWPGQTDWRKKPLQLVHFNENAAGETFFQRVQALLGQPHRAHVLTIYFFAMALGFQGRYALGGAGQLGPLYEAVGAACGQVVAQGDPIGPHAPRPDAGRNFLERQAPIVRASLVCFAIALLLFVVLRVVVSAQAASAERAMDDYSRGAGVGGP